VKRKSKKRKKKRKVLSNLLILEQEVCGWLGIDCRNGAFRLGWLLECIEEKFDPTKIADRLQLKRLFLCL
jgi:hypothetical protein